MIEWLTRVFGTWRAHRQSRKQAVTAQRDEALYDRLSKEAAPLDERQRRTEEQLRYLAEQLEMRQMRRGPTHGNGR
jgi:hypothetical protein